MPSGKTHDKITKVATLAIAVFSGIVTKDLAISSMTVVSFAFSGFMFGPDLDIYSRQYLRWCWLRWIWLPYQKRVKHRSWVSHGPIIGTCGRILYLGVAILAATAPASVIQLIFLPESQLATIRLIKWAISAISKYPLLFTWAAIGLELGAASHYFADWTVSFWKKRNK
ncbi:MAG: metal-binding protein [Oscillatoria sp. SIO1A7]|nr:metal-binding protein [Oscillatoria sp. SIO1A7]